MIAKTEDALSNGHSTAIQKDAHTTDKVASVSVWTRRSRQRRSSVFTFFHQPKEEQIVLNTIRCLAADLCQEVSNKQCIVDLVSS
jgi:hypothetical protein